MFHFDCRDSWRAVALAVACCAVIYPAPAKDTGPAKGTEQNVTDEDPKTALIVLKNAIRKSPQDPAIRVKIAKLYFKLGDISSAEREARTARDLKGDEADYLPILIDSLLRQRKYKDLYDLIEPGDREPVLEGKVRTALGSAAVYLGYDTKGEALLRDAIRLDPSLVEPRIQLARFLQRARPGDADGVIDAAIVANPQSAELLQVKGDMLWSRGDATGAMRLFGEALKIDPSYQLARISRANVRVALGEFAAADEDLDPILQATPQNFMANYLRGLEYVKQRKYDEADHIFTSISGGFQGFPYGYFVQGATKFALGQWEAAEVILGKYLSRVPGNLEAARLIASAALEQHGAARAIDYLKPLVDKSPPDARTLALLGNAYMADGKPQLALQQFEKAAALDPEDMAIKTRVAVAELGASREIDGLEKLEEVFAGGAGSDLAGPTLVLAELRTGHVEKADKVARSLIDRDAKNPLYQTLLGEVRVAQRDDAAAEAAFRAALSQNSEFSAAARDLAMLYSKTGRTDDAKRVYSDLLSKIPKNTTALLGLADIAIAGKKWVEATDLLNNARAAAAYDPIPGLKLVAFYEQRRDWKSAKAVAAELYAQFPRDVDVVVALAQTRVGSGDTDAAISAYKLAHQLAPDSGPIRSAYVNLLKQATYYREAREVLQEAIRRDPKSAVLKADLIRVDAEIDGVEGAISEARELAASDPGNSIYEVVSAELYERAGRGSEAVVLLEKSVAARPSDASLAAALSRLYIRMSMPAKAETFLKDRLNADPKDAAARSELAFYYMQQEKDTAAVAEYSRLLEDRPADPTALNNLAWLYQRQGELAKARNLAERAFTLSPEDPSIGDTLGWILLGQGEAETAIDYLDAANLRAPRNPTIQYHLAMALKRVGRAADARAMLEKLLGSGGSFGNKADAERLLRELKRS